MKRKIICFLLFLFVSSTIFSLEKNISGKELEALNKVYIIYCKDFEFKKENIDRIDFTILYDCRRAPLENDKDLLELENKFIQEYQPKYNIRGRVHRR